MIIEEQNQMLQVIEQSGLEESKSQHILSVFQSFFEQAAVWEEKAKALVITDASQIKEMKEAREGRLALKSIRVEAERTRKELKERSLREGKAIDGIANVIKALIVPTEQHLEKQEKFVQLQEEKRIANLKAEREQLLSAFEVETEYFDLGNMTEAAFDKLMQSSELAYNARIEAEKKAEAERIAKEKAEAEERERLRKENERLRQEAKEREEALRKEREEEQRIRAAEQARLDAERKEREAELRKEREERERIQAEIRAKEEAEEMAKAKAEAKRREEERKLAMQSDRQKIIDFAALIESIELPVVAGQESKKIIENGKGLLIKTGRYLREKAETV